MLTPHVIQTGRIAAGQGHRDGPPVAADAICVDAS